DAASRHRRRATIVQCAVAVVVWVCRSLVEIDDAVVQRTRAPEVVTPRYPSAEVCRIARERAVVQSAASRPAAEPGRIANYRAVIQRALPRPAAAVTTGIACQCTIRQG